MLYSIHQDNLYYNNRNRDNRDVFKDEEKISTKCKVYMCAAGLMWGATCFLSFSIGYHYESIYCNCSDTFIGDL